MPSQRQLLEEEYRQVEARLRLNQQVALKARQVAVTASGMELAKVQVGIDETEQAIRDDERRLDELAAEIEAASQSGPEPEPEMPRLPFEPETIPIPAGPFLMGSDDPAAPAAERPQHTLHLPDFRIGRRPVTVGQYAAFIKDAKAHPMPPGWFNRQPPPDPVDQPIVNVSWFDALAYCAWLSQQAGRRYTLPSEAEWEKACSNDLSRFEGMLGAVQQWTRSLWGSQPGQPDFGYPYDPADGREITDPAKLPAQARLVHRGGSFKSRPEDLRMTARGNWPPDGPSDRRGFRIVLILEETP